MQESGEDFGEQDEDIEIQNLPLYTECKADGIYRYRRRVPKNSSIVNKRVHKKVHNAGRLKLMLCFKGKITQHVVPAARTRVNLTALFLLYFIFR